MKMLHYLKKPEIIQVSDLSIFKKLIKILLLFLIYLACIIVVALLLTMIDRLILQKVFEHSILHQLRLNMNELSAGFGRYWFIFAVIYAPLIEELLFRLPLHLKKLTIAIALSLLSYRLMVVTHIYDFDVRDLYAYMKIAIALGMFILILKFFPDTLLAFLRKHYGFYFYFIAIAFAFIHLRNFSHFESSVFFFYPLFILPQFVMGLFIGYVRMEFGFFYGLLFHSMINLSSLLLSSFAGMLLF